jgi:hypothetical protein
LLPIFMQLCSSSSSSSSSSSLSSILQVC